MKQLILKTMFLLCVLIAGGSSMLATTYVKVTSTSDLVSGDVYIIATSSAVAISYSSNILNTTSSGFTESFGTITTTTATPMEFKLGTDSNNYTLQMSNNKYLGYYGGTSTTFRAKDDTSDDREKWTIANNATYDLFTIVNVATNTRFIGTATNAFRPYATSNMETYAPATLYKKQTTTISITAVSNNESWGTVEVSGNVITATPNSGYRVSKTTPYTITSGEIDDSTISQDGNSFIVTATGECTIRINFEAIPTHTAKFSINGDIDNSNNVVVGEGEIITFPATPTTLGGKAFVGWTTSAISGTTDTAPATLIKATTTLMGENDITYYVVYAIGSAGETTTLTDVLDYTVTGITSSDYYDFSDKQAENGSSAVYAGNCAGSEIYIRLRNEQNSGIISTTSGGKLKKVTVDWAGTQVRTLNIYGKNTAYTAASQLYDASASKRGTLLGTIVKDTSTELTVDGDYEYIGIRSGDAAIYLNSISVEWEAEEAEYSAYCTTVTVTTPAVTSDGWATYVTPYALRFDEGDAYIVNTTGDKVVYLESVTDVPASTPVILKGEGTKTASVLTTADAITNNKLAVSDGTITSCYVLANMASGVGFYKWNGNGTHTALSSGRVYLPTDVVTSAHEFLGLTLGDETGVNEVRGRRSEGRGEVYDLQGRKVLKPTQGLYIVNGKRVVVK